MNKYTHDFLLGLCCLPTIILIYFIGYYFDSIKTASAAAGMATILAFGANKSWNGSVNALMLTTLVGVSLSFILGVMLSQYPVLYISWICFLLYFYTLSSSIDTSLWWILLQCSITFIINGYSPISMSNLASGLTLIIFGGSIQILMISLIRKMNIFKTKNIRTDDFCFFLKIEFKKFKIQIKSFWVELLPIFILIIISLILKSYTIKNGYWVIMTFFICLRNDYVNTVARVRSRIIGTLVGCYVGYVFLINVDSELGRVFLSILFSFLAFTFSYNFISKSYMTFTFLVTIMVFLNISLLHNHDVALAYQRLYCSVAGGACALLSTFLKRKATNTNVN